MEGSEDGAEDSPIQLPAVLESAAAAVPETWRHRAAAAIFRLVAGTAYNKVQDASHRFDLLKGQSFVTEQLAVAAAAKAAADPAIVERAMNFWLAKEFRAQKVREDVAKLALEELSATEGGDTGSTAPPNAEAIDDEWFAKFDRVVEEVSSDEMKRLLARILAGEVRRAGSFSLRTLRFVGELDRETAKIFQDVCRDNLAGNSIFAVPNQWQGGENYRKVTRLIDHGLLVEKAGLSERATQGASNGKFQIVWGDQYRLVLHTPHPLRVPIIQLTQIGKEMLPLLGPFDELETLTKIYQFLLPKGPVRGAYIQAGGADAAAFATPIVRIIAELQDSP